MAIPTASFRSEFDIYNPRQNLADVGYTEVQAAFNAATSGTYGNKVHVPGGDIYLTDTLTLDNLRGMNIESVGRNTRFIWRGPNDRAALAIRDCRECFFKGFSIIADPSHPLAVGIDQYRAHSGGVWASSWNEYDSILVDGGVGGSGSGVTTCFRFGHSGGTDANNDFSYVRRCLAYNFETYGFYVYGSQNFGNEFRSCQSGGGGQYGVYQTQRAQFLWDGGVMSAHTGAAFHIEEAATFGPTRIVNTDSEGDNRFVEVVGAQTAALDVSWNRIDGSAVNADGIICDFSNVRGGLTTIGNTITEVGTKLRMRWQWAGNGGFQTPGATWRFEQNTLLQPEALRPGAPVSPDSGPSFFTDLVPTHWGGNLVVDLDNVDSKIAWNRTYWSLNPSNDTTPTVNLYEDYYVLPASPLTITNFTEGYSGQPIRLLFLNGNATIQNNANIKLAGGADFVGTTNDVLHLRNYQGVWVEEGRSVN